MKRWKIANLALIMAAASLLIACDDDDGLAENTGRPCAVPEDCYPEVTPGDLSGDVVCLDRTEQGYCTHHCETDEDCCAIAGECKTPEPQVCAPFESTGMRLCFLSCENDDIGNWESSDYCAHFAGPGYGCRSTGGGSDNRRVCWPN